MISELETNPFDYLYSRIFGSIFIFILKHGYRKGVFGYTCKLPKHATIFFLPNLWRPFC